MQYIDDVRNILAEILSLGPRAKTLTSDSALIGAIPEFDSMSVVSLIAALEDHFGILIEDDEITSMTFETVGSLARFVDQKLVQ